MCDPLAVAAIPKRAARRGLGQQRIELAAEH
jgi:hypothetical protein